MLLYIWFEEWTIIGCYFWTDIIISFSANLGRLYMQVVEIIVWVQCVYIYILCSYVQCFWVWYISGSTQWFVNIKKKLRNVKLFASFMLLWSLLLPNANKFSVRKYSRLTCDHQFTGITTKFTSKEKLKICWMFHHRNVHMLLFFWHPSLVDKAWKIETLKQTVWDEFASVIMLLKLILHRKYPWVNCFYYS